MARRKRTPAADDDAALQGFLDRVDKAYSRRLLTTPDGLSSSWTMRAEAGGPVEVTTRGPSPEDLEGLLIVLRPMIVEGEPIRLGRIWDTLERRLTSDELRDDCRAVRRGYLASMRRPSLAIVVDGRTIRPDHLLGLFMNGEAFHVDAAKGQELAALRARLQGISDQTIVEAVQNTVRACRDTAWIILEAQRRNALG